MRKLVLLAFGLLTARAGFAIDYKVKNEAELIKANFSVAPGDAIVLQNGTWKDIKIVLTCKGTAAAPITIKAETPGKVMITGNSSMRIGGQYLVISGLHFLNGSAAEGSVWEYRAGKQVANYCRITNCFIDGFNNVNRLDENYWVAFYGQHNRMDHCSFQNKTNLGVLLAVILDDDRSRLNDHRIDSNHFGYRRPLGSNAGEIIRVGVSQHCTFYSNTIIENNFFEYCDGETEIVSIKSCGNVVRQNVFKECQGAVVLRHGNNNTVEGNLFYGNGKKGTGGVRVINEGNWVVNNLFYECRGEDFRASLAIMNGVPNSPPHRYLPVRDALIASNTYVNCTPFSLGEGADAERSMEPRNVFILNNIFYNTRDSILYKTSSRTDSIFLAGNQINHPYKQSLLKGFQQSSFSMNAWKSKSIPASKPTNAVAWPLFFSQQAATKLGGKMPATIGCSQPGKFEGMLKRAASLGIQWKNSVIQPAPLAKTVEVSGTEQLIAALQNPNVIIQLRGGTYMLQQPLHINGKATIRGKGQTVILQSRERDGIGFSIGAESILRFEQVDIRAEGQWKSLMAADSSGSGIHYSLFIRNSQFNGFSGRALFYAARTTYADSIVIENSRFSHITGAVCQMDQEKDDKGYYSVENMRVENCLFENVKGMILHLYRGGNDESTMGPRLVFKKNAIINCKNDGALIWLHGVQESRVFQNRFSNPAQTEAEVKYSDVVRGLHYDSKNQYSAPDKLKANQFLITQ